jgi:hypothetical protein
MVSEVHMAACPVCFGRGPIDVHKTHKIWSLVLLTSWNSFFHVCCRSCGIKKQLGALVFSGLLGWWGFPWGLIMTPIQIARNLGAMMKKTDPYRPSEELQEAVRFDLALQVLAQQAQQEQPA